MSEVKVKAQRPQYQLLEPAYMTGPKGYDELLDPEKMPYMEPEIDPETGEEVTKRRPLLVYSDANPGHHMKPMNDAARAKWIEYWGTPYEDTPRPDPIRGLTISAPHSTNADQKGTRA